MKDIKELINDYSTQSVQEQIIKKKFLDFYSGYNNCFSSHQEYGHFTASGFVVNSDMSKYLLLYHKKLKIWLQPGGHCMSNDILKEAIRECSEETSSHNIKLLSDKIFDLDIHLVTETSDQKQHYHYDVRFLLQLEDEEINVNEEATTYKWMNFEEYIYHKDKLDKSVSKMIEKFLQYFSAVK